MRLSLLVLAFWVTALYANESVKGGSETDFSARRKSSSHSSPREATSRSGSCDGDTLGRLAKESGGRTATTYRCRIFVEAALRKAGCRIPLGGPESFHNVSKVWSRCGHSTGDAPNGAVMMYSNGRNRHYEVKYNGCYYSDFHHPDCKPATQFSHPFKLIGWCAP